MALGRDGGAVTKGWTGRSQFGLEPDMAKVRLIAGFATGSPIWASARTFRDAGTPQQQASLSPCTGPVEAFSDISVLSASQLGDFSKTWDFRRKKCRSH